MKEALLRKLPKVDELLRHPSLEPLALAYGNAPVREAVRQEIALLREGILGGSIGEVPAAEPLLQSVQERIRKAALPSFRPVINGTGVILHTNLGRSPLSEKAAKAVYEAVRGYSNLEYDLESGSRGSRYSHVEPLLCRITGAESALVVNNNAAAVLLILSALTAGGEVIVSRGELVEIGGAFRVPEIMESCGARLREVGTTNKTHLYDYERAINENTRALMKVHTSNYRIIGFSETPALSELAALAHGRGLPVIEDLGSGALTDLHAFGIHGEPTVAESLRAGVDVLSFSGDKLLGGPQAGIILGKKKYIDILKKHPLNRALRVDKMTLAALEATLQSYAAGKTEEIPVAAMLGAEKGALEAKAAALCALLRNAGIPCAVAPCESQVGGGSVPGQTLPSFAVVFEEEAEGLEARLRRSERPVIGRIHDGRFLLDVRCLREEDFPTIAEALA